MEDVKNKFILAVVRLASMEAVGELIMQLGMTQGGGAPDWLMLLCTKLRNFQAFNSFSRMPCSTLIYFHV